MATTVSAEATISRAPATADRTPLKFRPMAASASPSETIPGVVVTTHCDSDPDWVGSYDIDVYDPSSNSFGITASVQLYDQSTNPPTPYDHAGPDDGEPGGGVTWAATSADLGKLVKVQVTETGTTITEHYSGTFACDTQMEPDNSSSSPSPSPTNSPSASPSAAASMDFEVICSQNGKPNIDIYTFNHTASTVQVDLSIYKDGQTLNSSWDNHSQNEAEASNTGNHWGPGGTQYAGYQVVAGFTGPDVPQGQSLQEIDNICPEDAGSPTPTPTMSPTPSATVSPTPTATVSPPPTPSATMSPSSAAPTSSAPPPVYCVIPSVKHETVREAQATVKGANCTLKGLVKPAAKPKHGYSVVADHLALKKTRKVHRSRNGHVSTVIETYYVTLKPGAVEIKGFGVWLVETRVANSLVKHAEGVVSRAV